jgi:hypothetical protein
LRQGTLGVLQAVRWRVWIRRWVMIATTHMHVSWLRVIFSYDR